MSSTPHLTFNLSNPAHRVMARLAQTTSVVVLKVSGRYTLLLEPGLGTPWRGQGLFGEKRGDDLARDAEANGVPAKRMTWSEAYALLVKQEGGEAAVEKALTERIVQKQSELSNPTPKRIPSKD